MKSKIETEEYQDIFKGLFNIQISDHPKSGLIRVIDYMGANVSSRYNVIENDAVMHFFTKDGEYLPEFTQKVNQNGKDWKVDNSYQVTVMSATGEPVLDEENNVVKQNAYDYFSNIILNSQLSLKQVLQMYILQDDAKQAFD